MPTYGSEGRFGFVGSFKYVRSCILLGSAVFGLFTLFDKRADDVWKALVFARHLSPRLLALKSDERKLKAVNA